MSVLQSDIGFSELEQAVRASFYENAVMVFSNKAKCKKCNTITSDYHYIDYDSENSFAVCKEHYQEFVDEYQGALLELEKQKDLLFNKFLNKQEE